MDPEQDADVNPEPVYSKIRALEVVLISEKPAEPVQVINNDCEYNSFPKLTSAPILGCKVADLNLNCTFYGLPDIYPLFQEGVNSKEDVK